MDGMAAFEDGRIKSRHRDAFGFEVLHRGQEACKILLGGEQD